MPYENPADRYFTFNKRPVIQDGRVEPHNQEILTPEKTTHHIDEIAKLAIPEAKDLVDCGVDAFSAAETAVSYALAEFEGGRYQGQCDAVTRAQIEGIVLEKCYTKTSKKASVEDIVSRLDKVASILEANGLTKIAELVDAAANTIEKNNA